MQSDLPQSNPTPITEESPSPKNLQKRLSKKVLILGGVAGLLLIIIVTVLLASRASNNTRIEQQANLTVTPAQQSEEVRNAAQPTAAAAQENSQTLVYGVWTGQESVIRTVDTATSTVATIASLPLQIKKVSVLPNKHLLYIDQTDTKDHGTRISVYDVERKAISYSIQASDGFGIDDYVLSPDKKFIAIWEVSFAQGSQILQGGRSRVYAVDLSRPTVKELLYDEVSSDTTPVHYPRAILNDGTVFADKFLPNDPKGGAGWAYGMSVVDFDGTNKREIDTMKAGTYGTQPYLSPDGKYLVFAGYDGSRGEGTAVNNGYRQALLTPNTVELLNTQSLQRFKLPNLPNSDTYPSAKWDTLTGNVIIAIISPEAKKTGVYAYNLGNQLPKEIAMPRGGTSSNGIISQLSADKTLIGTKSDNESQLGNLGESYAYTYTQIAKLKADGSLQYLTLQDPFVQYITILPSNYFEDVLGIQIVPQANAQIIDQYSNQNEAKQNLQLYTFFLKTDLSDSRKFQQSTPAQQNTPINDDDDHLPECRNLAAEQCRAQGITDESSDEFDDCEDTLADTNDDAGKCQDSPLYLYGTPGKQVRVKIQTPIYNALPASAGEYAVTLLQNGGMQINDTVYQSIAYDYRSNLRRIQPPRRGAIATKSEVATILKHYAKKLGLNEKETTDLIRAGKEKVSTPYVFISFFDHQTSHAILPISFSPEPDNYLNVVFYFKGYEQRPGFIPLPPVFPEPIKRTGFTAVEVSEMVE